jgi:transcriptional regulator with XRE-family HTH domain
MTPDIKVRVAVVLKHLREKAGKTQTEMAECLGITQGLVSRYEKKVNTLTTVRQFAECLGYKASRVIEMAETADVEEMLGWKLKDK